MKPEKLVVLGRNHPLHNSVDPFVIFAANNEKNDRRKVGDS